VGAGFEGFVDMRFLLSQLTGPEVIPGDITRGVQLVFVEMTCSPPHCLLAGWLPIRHRRGVDVRSFFGLCQTPIFRNLVRERHSDFGCFSRLEGVHLASHGFWRKPRGHGVPTPKGLIDGPRTLATRVPRVSVARQPSRNFLPWLRRCPPTRPGGEVI